jgi:hypothetical protein
MSWAMKLQSSFSEALGPKLHAYATTARTKGSVTPSCRKTMFTRARKGKHRSHSAGHCCLYLHASLFSSNFGANLPCDVSAFDRPTTLLSHQQHDHSFKNNPCCRCQCSASDLIDVTPDAPLTKSNFDYERLEGRMILPDVCPRRAHHLDQTTDSPSWTDTQLAARRLIIQQGSTHLNGFCSAGARSRAHWGLARCLTF